MSLPRLLLAQSLTKHFTLSSYLDSFSRVLCLLYAYYTAFSGQRTKKCPSKVIWA
jgi:hypothetical protein